MQLSKPRKIILNNLQLRKIRVNLRIIFRLACLDELKRLSKREWLYREKRIQKGFLTESQFKREKFLSQSYREFHYAYRKSILRCFREATCVSFKEEVEKGLIKPSERPIDLDMVWVPHYKA